MRAFSACFLLLSSSSSFVCFKFAFLYFFSVLRHSSYFSNFLYHHLMVVCRCFAHVFHQLRIHNHTCHYHHQDRAIIFVIMIILIIIKQVGISITTRIITLGITSNPSYNYHFIVITIILLIIVTPIVISCHTQSHHHDSSSEFLPINLSLPGNFN